MYVLLRFGSNCALLVLVNGVVVSGLVLVAMGCCGLVVGSVVVCSATCILYRSDTFGSMTCCSVR